MHTYPPSLYLSSLHLLSIHSLPTPSIQLSLIFLYPSFLSQRRPYLPCTRSHRKFLYILSYSPPPQNSTFPPTVTLLSLPIPLSTVFCFLPQQLLPFSPLPASFSRCRLLHLRPCNTTFLPTSSYLLLFLFPSLFIHRSSSLYITSSLVPSA